MKSHSYTTVIADGAANLIARFVASYAILHTQRRFLTDQPSDHQYPAYKAMPAQLGFGMPSKPCCV
jgi:hypothetical protein